MNCGTCRFWGKNVPDPHGEISDQTGDWRQCGRVVHEDSYFQGKDFQKELALVVDGSNFFAALKCRSDFGCVLHEPLVGSGAEQSEAT